MCGKLGRTSSLKQYQTKTLDTKRNKNKGFFKRSFYCWDAYPNLFKNDAILSSSEKRFFMKTCDYQTIQLKALSCSLKESPFYME